LFEEIETHVFVLITKLKPRPVKLSAFVDSLYSHILLLKFYASESV